MMTDLIWYLLLVQIVMGAFDTLYHHEMTERLAWRGSQKTELCLHAVRNGLYAIIFLALGWAQPAGAWAMLLLALLAAEVMITLWDFVEEDLSRKLPATERVAHTLMALNYGAILILLIPVLLNRVHEPAGLTLAYYGIWSWVCLLAVVAVAVFGLRDFLAARRMARIVEMPACRLSIGLTGRKTVLVTGATGFVGERLVQALVAGGHDVIALVRTPEKAMRLAHPIRLITSLDQISDLETIDAIINLAGEPVANGLWTVKKRRQIIQSRTGMAGDITRLVKRLISKPESLITASAIGWYGLHGEEILTECGEAHSCFSHESCERVERAARDTELFGVRVVRLRIGLVLGKEGGLLARMLLPFEFGLGGPFGKGRHYMSWITRDDLVQMIIFAMRTKEIHGPLNATAPEPVTNASFSKALGKALHRPVFMAIPAAPIALLLGDFGRELLLGGQRVVPEKALTHGFQFHHPDLEEALKVILGAKEKKSMPATIYPARRKWKLHPYFP